MPERMGDVTAGSQILIAEDDADTAGILASYLLEAGFDPITIGDGQSALESILNSSPTLVILDLVLPGLDGTEVCRRVRTVSAVPIIMVSGRAEELDRLLGLELGADDYICKPFSPREVVARVKAVLRRVAPAAAASAPPDPQAPTLLIDDASLRVTVDGVFIDLTPTEFKVFALLASRPGRVLSRAQILDLAYADDLDVSDRTVDSHVKNIRRKIARATPGQEFIHSVYGVGYRFER